MTKLLNILTILILLLTSCNHSATNQKSYIESQPTFFKLKNGNWLTNTWIRKPENLLKIHETFKKFGYSNLISDDLLSENPLIIQDIYINRKGKYLLDSLELTYGHENIKDKYYREFWQRRKLEKNDKVVFQIIKDINYAFKDKLNSVKLSMDAKPKFINDTLLNLLQIEYRTDPLSDKFAQQDFETLRKFGFHQSAYTLLFEKTIYENINWDKSSLDKTLKKSDRFIYPWFSDDTP